VKLTTHPHLVPRLKNVWRYTITPQSIFMGGLLNYAQDASSWHGA